jgi:ankyrin repeat protein
MKYISIIFVFVCASTLSMQRSACMEIDVPSTYELLALPNEIISSIICYMHGIKPKLALSAINKTCHTLIHSLPVHCLFQFPLQLSSSAYISGLVYHAQKADISERYKNIFSRLLEDDEPDNKNTREHIYTFFAFTSDETNKAIQIFSEKNSDTLTKTLVKAIQEKSIPVTDLCIKQGVDVNKKYAKLYVTPSSYEYYTYHSPLSYIYDDNNTILKMLLAQGADVNELPIQCIHSSETMKIALLYSPNLEIKNMYGHTPLEHMAECWHGKKIIPYLLAAGAQVSSRALERAARFNRYKNVRLLLTNINKTQESDLLHWIGQATNRPDMIKLLVKDRVLPVNTQDNEGRTPLHKVAWNDNLYFARWLIAHGAYIDRATHNGWTPLHFAAANNARNIINILLTAGANVDLKTDEGETPLHIAARNNRQGAVEMLLAAGADINSQSNNGDTPLHKARYFDHIVAILFNAKANVDIKNNAGQTALECLAYSMQELIKKKMSV